MRLQLIGKVIGTAMQKTAKVKVDRLVRHPLYDRVRTPQTSARGGGGAHARASADGRRSASVDAHAVRCRPAAQVMRKSKNYLVHDERAVAVVGDTVRIEECPPVSKHKRAWGRLCARARMGRDADPAALRNRHALGRARIQTFSCWKL